LLFPAAEEKQLRKLTARRDKGNYKGYFFVLIFLIGLVNILDEVTSNLSVSVQSSFITEFFVNNPLFGKQYTFEEGLSLHSTIGVVSYVFGLITPFYKALADIYESNGDEAAAETYKALFAAWLNENRAGSTDIDAQGFAK